MKMFSKNPPAPSIEMRTLDRYSLSVQAKDVNWLPHPYSCSQPDHWPFVLPRSALRHRFRPPACSISATLPRTLRHSLMRHQLACRCAGNIRPRSCSGFMSQKRFFAGHKVAWRLSRLVEQRAICAGARFQYPHYTRVRHRFGLRYRQGSSVTKPEQNPSRLFP